MTPYYEDAAAGIVIYHGNCLEIMPLLAESGVDLIVTDPPYGVGMEYDDYEDNLPETTQLAVDFVRVAVTVSRSVAFTAGKWETERDLFRVHPPQWRMCWYKGAQSTASPIGFCDWEMVLIYGRNLCRGAHDYFFAQPEKMGAFGHPCPKPLEYSKCLIRRLAVPGGLVLDPFLGSGTTLRAAKDLGHPAIGIELSERYCEIAANRLRQGVLFDATGNRLQSSQKNGARNRMLW